MVKNNQSFIILLALLATIFISSNLQAINWTKVRSSLWKLYAFRTAFELGAVFGVIFHPLIKLYPEKTSLKQRCLFLKRELDEQARLSVKKFKNTKQEVENYAKRHKQATERGDASTHFG